MRHPLRQRLWARDGDPGMIAWAIASISLVLPVAGLFLCIIGGAQVIRGSGSGWAWLVLGAVLIVLDLIIDFVWARSSLFESDVPHLNRRADQLADRRGVVVEAIEGGRGKIRLGDTLWVAEGPDLPAGTTVRITSAKATVLVVEPAERSASLATENPPSGPQESKGT